jgi:hypothetical protein
MNLRLVLLSDVPEDFLFAHAVAKVANLPLTREFNETVTELSHSIFLVDACDELLLGNFETMMEKHKEHIEFPVHFIGSSHLHTANHLAKKTWFGNYLVRDSKNATKVGEQYGKVLKASLSPSAFGIFKFLKPTADIRHFNFTNTNQKQQVQDDIANYLLSNGFNNRCTQTIVTGVDELLMNAMFDAPIDESGRAIYELTKRNTEIPLDLKSGVTLSFGFDGESAVFGITDNFGSLHRIKLLAYLSKMQNNSPYVVKHDTAGAGIGLSNIHLSGGSLYFVSKSQEKTEVMLFFKKTSSYVDFRSQFKFIATKFYP